MQLMETVDSQVDRATGATATDASNDLVDGLGNDLVDGLGNDLVWS